MNAPLLVVACIGLSAGAAFFVARNVPPGSNPLDLQGAAAGTANPAEKIAALEQTVRDLEVRVRALDPTNARRADPVIDEEKLARAVAARLGVNVADKAAGPEVGRAAGASPAAARKDPASRRTVEEYVAQLSDLKLDFNQRTELWKKAKDGGFADDLLAAFEERARTEPNNSKAHTDLGVALLSKMMQTEQGPASWALSGRADKAFDRALEVDDHNWDARFQKAVSLSFWPPALGRGPEAVKHFETLIQQQKDAPQRPEFATTYLFLGNMLDQQGKHDQAMDVWRRGLTAFPDHADLKGKLK